MKKLFILGILTAPVFATEFDVNTYEPSLDFAQVTNVVAIQRKTGTWCFDTSVRHHDQGWEHYADRWEVLDLEGNVLGYRTLGHPHDNEQPFTRSRCKIDIPANMSKVIVRAKCNKHGFGGKAMLVSIKTKSVK